MVTVLCAVLFGAERSPSAAGAIDDEILKPVVEETRLNLLARRVTDLKTPLPPDKAFGFTNSNAVSQAADRVARGMQSRTKFLSDAPKLLEKRRKEVEQVFGDQLDEAKELVKKPHNQAELFVMLLTDAVRQMRLPADQSQPRTLLAKRLQALFDEDARRRKGKGGPEEDRAWLDQYERETGKELLRALRPETQKELIRVWPVLFPDGPEAPAQAG